MLNQLQNFEMMYSFNRDYNNLININLILISFLFFSFGNFGFLNLFSNALVIQSVLFSTTTIISSIIILKNINNMHNLIKDKLILFLISFGVISFIYHTIGVTFIYTIFLVITLYFLKENQRNFIIKSIIIICSIFSIMAIIQFFIILLDPSIVNTLEDSFSSTTGSDMLYSNNTLDYFGYVVHGKTTTLFSHEVFRLKSFGSEPSVLVYLFVAPAILALSYSKIMKFVSIPIFIFILFIASSGTIYLSIGLGLFIYYAKLIVPKKPTILTITIIVSIVISFIVISKIDSKFFVLSSVDVISNHKEVKTSSAIARITAINVVVNNILSSPFAIIKDSNNGMPLGFFLKAFVKTGLIGLILSIIFFYYFFLSIAKIMIYSKFKLFSALSLGMFTQVASFSSYGWFGMTGILMIGLYYLRFKDLLK